MVDEWSPELVEAMYNALNYQLGSGKFYPVMQTETVMVDELSKR